MKLSEPVSSALFIFVPALVLLALVLAVVSAGAREIERDAQSCRDRGLRPVRGYERAIECAR